MNLFDMTYGELYKYVKKQIVGMSEEQIDDWRPADGFYIDDIVKTRNSYSPYVPNGIRIWLKNGDSIIYAFNGQCKNCEYRSDEFTSVCVNPDSPKCADFVSADDACDHWEKRKCESG